MKLNFLKRKKVFKKGSSVINPNIYWHFILSLSFVAAAGLLVFAIFLFREVDQKNAVLEAEIDRNAFSEREERINQTLEYFENREAASTRITNSPAPFVDPSR